MAYLGLRKIKIAKLNGSTYDKPVSLGKAIGLNVNPSYAEGSVYGDDELAEYDKEFRYADVTLDTSTIPIEADEQMFGHTVNKEKNEIVYKSEQYSFVCVQRDDRLPGPDNPMQSPRRHARFPVASTPAGEPCRFHCQKSHVPDVPIRFPGQGHGQRASYFQGRSFRPQQRCLRSHLPKPGSRQVRHNKGLCCSPSLLRLVLQSPSYIWGL